MIMAASEMKFQGSFWESWNTYVCKGSFYKPLSLGMDRWSRLWESHVISSLQQCLGRKGKEERERKQEAKQCRAKASNARIAELLQVVGGSRLENGPAAK